MAAIPEHRRIWLADLPFLHQDIQRVFVHAGLEPYVAIADQNPEACLWIREAFLRAPADAFPRHIVHGHTPIWAGKPEPAPPELLAHRTNRQR